MLFNQGFHRNNYRDILLFTISILLKFFILHYLIGIRQGIIGITIKNFAIVIAMYCFIVVLLKKGKRPGVLLGINIILSIIFFIDIMYYSHFFTLMPAHSIYNIGQLGPVSGSIISLVKIEYFLLFLDSWILWRYYKKYKDREIGILHSKKQKVAFLLTFFTIISFCSGINYRTIVNADGNYTPQNLGVINYHLVDAMMQFTDNPLDIDRAEEVIETTAPIVESKNKFGLAKDKNVIVIQAESLQNFVINQEIEGQMITPILNELINNESIYFSNYYEQVGWGNTSDAEFISHNSFYPSIKNSSYRAYEGNEFNTLPSMLKEKGYSTMVFHGNEADFWNRRSIYPSQGLDEYISLEKLEQDEMIGIGLSDGSLFNQSIEYLKKQNEPFYSFMITLTSHHPFIMDERHKGLDIKGEYKDTVLEDYLQSVHYLDEKIGEFIERLKEEGLYEDTMIVIYGDHEGLNMKDEESNRLLSSFLDKSYREDEMFRVPLIAHIPNSNVQKNVITTGGQIDFFPTIGNLLGLEIDPDKVLGKDLLNTEEGFVAKQVHLVRGSFVDDEKIFIMSEDGLFENSKAWDIHTDKEIDIENCRSGYERILGEVNLSEYILQNNLMPLVKEKGIQYIIQNAENIE